MEVEARQALLMRCFNFIPQRLVAQFLHSHDSPEGLKDADETFLYADPDVLACCKVCLTFRSCSHIASAMFQGLACWACLSVWTRQAELWHMQVLAAAKAEVQAACLC